MFSKAVLTLLAIGALSINVLAIPIPIHSHRDSHLQKDQETPGASSSNTDPSIYDDPRNYDPADQALMNIHNGGNPSHIANSHPPNIGGNLGAISEEDHSHEEGGELPRSFSAISYRDPTFVFSVIEPAPPAPAPGLMSKLKSKVGKCLGELPRSFSVLSYRNLTFVFSRVVWAPHITSLFAFVSQKHRGSYSSLFIFIRYK